MSISMRKMFQNVSFRRKLTLTYLLAILVPLTVLVSVLAATMMRANEDNMKSLSVKIHNQGLHYINNLADGMHFTASVIYFDKTLLNFFMRENETVAEQSAMYTKTSSSLYIIARNNGMERIRLFVDRRYFFSNEQMNFFSFEEAIRSGWVDQNKDKPYSKWTTDSYSLLPSQKLSRFDTITYVSSLTNLDRYDKCTAIIAIDVLRSSVVSELQYFVGTTNDCDMYITDSDGNIICTSSTANIASMPVFTEDQRWIHAKVGGTASWIYASPTNMRGWKLVTVLHDNAIARSGVQSLTALFILTVLVTLVVMVVTMYVSKMNSQRINRLTAYAARVQSGDLTPTSEDYGTDEIGQLCDAFNYTIHILSQLISEQQQSFERMKNAEIRSIRSELEVLQTQINPHFLYNTLSVINWTAAKYDCKEVESQILMLAKYYKGCLSKGETLVTILSEVENAQLYVKLQNLRSGCTIRLDADIDDVAHLKIPKLTIQPLIENSIIHGILPKETKEGTIKIKGSYDESFVLLYIIDDGVGFDCVNPPGSFSSNGYGIENVISRLKMYFGEECSLQYISGQEDGTTVVIKIKNKNN